MAQFSTAIWTPLTLNRKLSTPENFVIPSTTRIESLFLPAGVAYATATAIAGWCLYEASASRRPVDPLWLVLLFAGAYPFTRWCADVLGRIDAVASGDTRAAGADEAQAKALVDYWMRHGSAPAAMRARACSAATAAARAPPR